MTTSLPSTEVYAVDIPEADDFNAKFQYNFFSPDESVNEEGSAPVSLLARSSDQIDASFVQFASSRAPRMVTFSWSVPKVAQQPGVPSDQDVNANSFRVSNIQKGSLISDNITKVVTEDHFASNNFSAVSFSDGKIADKVYAYISGTFAMQTLGNATSPDFTLSKLAMLVGPMVKKLVSPAFLSQGANNQSVASGVTYVDDAGQLPSTQSSAYIASLSRVAVDAQINSKLLADVTGRIIKDPSSPFAGNATALYAYAKNLKKAQQGKQTSPSDADYTNTVTYVSVTPQPTAYTQNVRNAELVGFIIDKTEVLPDGTTRACPPVIIESPYVGQSLDFRVKYGTSYMYAVRSVAVFTVPAIDFDTNEVATLQLLVSSKPSAPVVVDTHEYVAPPTPADFNLRWDYNDNRLVLAWTFPPNPQRDIKKWQVFKRASVQHPFELQKMYDFDDSQVRYPNREDPDPMLVEYTDGPVSFWKDEAFDFTVSTKESTAPIYTVASVDAHGFTSGFAEQYRVWFDPFKNALQKKLVSIAGAPKPYPNMHLDGEAFVNSVRVSGPNSKTMRLYFNPQFYYLYDSKGRMQRSVQTKQDGGLYRFSFLNLDAQRSQVTTVQVDNRIGDVGATAGSVAFGAGSSVGSVIK